MDDDEIALLRTAQRNGHHEEEKLLVAVEVVNEGKEIGDLS